MSQADDISKECAHCGTTFQTSDRSARFCSEGCQQAAETGESSNDEEIRDKLNEWRQEAMGKLLSLRFQEQNLDEEQKHLQQEGKMLCPVCRGKGKYAGKPCSPCDGKGYWGG